jgi:hypothetical protein
MPAKSRDAIVGSFDEYRQLILHTLERLQLGITAIEIKLDELRKRDLEAMKIDIAMLKVRASIFGGLAGAVAGALLSAIIGKLMR